MSFSLTVQTSDEMAAKEQSNRLVEAQRECRRRILAIVDETAQSNLLAAKAVDGLSAEQASTFAAGVAWIGAMRATWRTLGAVDDVTDDTHWPPVPDGVAELGALF